ncbi:unnamed protein product [Urochloa humidicola]
MGTRLLRLLLLQLGAVAAASCLCILAAGCPLDAEQRVPPSNGVPAGTAAVAAAPAAGVVNDGATPAPPDESVPAVASIFRGARRFGPPRHLRLSDIVIVTADAPAATYTADEDIAPASAGPSGAHAGGRTSLLAIFSPVFFILGCGLFVAGLFMSADLYAAAKVRRQKAKRVRPLGQDAVDAAAAGP